MKIKRSGRVVLITTLVLLMFTAMVLWHDKPPGSVDAESNKVLVEMRVRNLAVFQKFLQQMEQISATPAFYLVGVKGGQSWPVNGLKACYADPLVLRWSFSEMDRAYTKGKELIRYRSLEDFLEILVEEEKRNTGFIATLDFGTHKVFREARFSIFLRAIFALLLGITGLLIVRSIPK